MFAMQQQIEIKEEGERNMREMIKVEQDEAYQQSLAIDRYILTLHFNLKDQFILINLLFIYI